MSNKAHAREQEQGKNLDPPEAGSRATTGDGGLDMGRWTRCAELDTDRCPARPATQEIGDAWSHNRHLKEPK